MAACALSKLEPKSEMSVKLHSNIISGAIDGLVYARNGPRQQVYLFWSVDTFVSHIACDEPDCAKHAKLNALQLSSDEWNHIKLFLNLLGVSVTFCFHTCWFIHA
jgi:hypothetical protein